jgi:hypothetical protein
LLIDDDADFDPAILEGTSAGGWHEKEQDQLLRTVSQWEERLRSAGGTVAEARRSAFSGPTGRFE